MAATITSLQTDGFALVRWSSIFAGVVTALLITIMLNLLGIAFGCSLFSFTDNTLTKVTYGTLIWLAITSIVAMYTGGWVASRFRLGETNAGMLHGLMSGGVASLIIIMLTTSGLSSILSGSFSILQSLVSASGAIAKEGGGAMLKAGKIAGQLSPELKYALKNAMPDLAPAIDSIKDKAYKLLPQENDATIKDERFDNKVADSAKSQLEKTVLNYLESLGGTNESITKETVKTDLARITKKSTAEIDQILNEWRNIYIHAKDKAKDVALDSGKKIADIISKMVWLNLFILLISLGAACMGGLHGTPRELDI